MRFSDLVRGASLRGAPEVLTPTTSLRLGRAIGTFLRRRGLAHRPTLVGRSGGAAEATVRDGVVAGLVASGIVVADLGIVESDRFTSALRQRPGPGIPGGPIWPVGSGVIVSTASDSVGVMLFAGTRPLVGEHLTAVARLADDDSYASAGAGRLVMIDTRRLPPPANVDDTLADDAADDDADDRMEA